MAVPPAPHAIQRPLADRPLSALTRLRRGLVWAAAMTLLAAVALPTPAAADPEGTPSTLLTALDEAVRGYLDAQAVLEASVARQKELEANLAAAEANFTVGQQRVGEIAAGAFMASGLTSVAGVISSGKPDDFLERITLLNGLSAHEQKAVVDLVRARNEVDRSKAALEAEIATQAETLAAMNARKQQAESALWAVGGGQVTGGFNDNSGAIAEAVPRNADGSLSRETCSVPEATTGGCTTARTAHARDQAIGAEFSNFVSCYRAYNDGGEHPQGRACDFAAAPGGFGGDASGAARTYGNSLAAYFIYNANRLGVLYVIWYRQIWLPSSGWRSYSGCCDPSAMHTNHVHLSMY